MATTTGTTNHNPTTTVRLNDAEFIQKFVDLDQNQSHLARVMGISPQGVSKRLKKLHVLLPKSETSGLLAGKAAVLVHAEMTHQVAKNFDEGVQNTISEMRSLAKLSDLLHHLEENLEFITTELRTVSTVTGKRKLQPHLIKLMINTAKEARGIITDSFQIKKDLFQLKGNASFMEAVMQVFLRYDPDIRRKLFIELSRLGTGEQVFGLDEGEGPNA